MKLVYCECCGEVAGPFRGVKNVRWCQCHRYAWWLEDGVGTLRIFTVDTAAPRCWVLSITNYFLRDEQPIETVKDIARVLMLHADDSLFVKSGSCIIRHRPGDDRVSWADALPNDHEVTFEVDLEKAKLQGVTVKSSMEKPEVPKIIKEIADNLGGKVDMVSGPLPDGSGFTVVSFPLPKDHWLYVGDAPAQQEDRRDGFNVPPMVMRTGTNLKTTREIYTEMLRRAGRYAVRCATMNGTEKGFDPDALLQSLVVGFLGYHTPDGLSSDEWANPVDPSCPSADAGRT
jgi:hypothetical protein